MDIYLISKYSLPFYVDIRYREARCGVASMHLRMVFLEVRYHGRLRRSCLKLSVVWPSCTSRWEATLDSVLSIVAWKGSVRGPSACTRSHVNHLIEWTISDIRISLSISGIQPARKCCCRREAKAFGRSKKRLVYVGVSGIHGRYLLTYADVSGICSRYLPLTPMLACTRRAYNNGRPVVLLG